MAPDRGAVDRVGHPGGLVGRHLEQADARIWGGGALVVGGVLALIALEG